MKHRYGTLWQARQEIKVEATDDSGDEYIKELLYWTSARIDARTGRWFWPLSASRSYDAIGAHIGAYHLDIDADLLALTSITNGDGAAIGAGDVLLYPPNVTPAWRLKLKTSAATAFTYTTDWEQAVSVSGVWGYHSSYSRAWTVSGLTTADNPLSSSATALTVSANVQQRDTYGLMPRLSAGNLIRLENEFCEVLDASGTTVSLRRGVNGTTAASHAAGTAVEVFQVEDAINRACVRWTAYLYARRGEYAQTTFDGVGTTSYPADMPAEIAAALAHYTRTRIAVL